MIHSDDRVSGKEDAPQRDEVGALFAFANILLRHKPLFLAAMVVGGVVAVAWRYSRPPAYVSSATFIPQGAQDTQRSGLAALAGQFGVGLGSSGGAQSPKFYTDLFQSYDFLVSIARETLTVAEEGGARRTLADLYEINQQFPAVRDEAVVALLTGLITSAVDAKTGAVTLYVSTRWPSVSYAIARRVVERVNEYNLNARQSQAGSERRFIGQQLAEARDTLSVAEGRLRAFLQNNREWSRSPELTFVHGQVERSISFAEQQVQALTQAYADARIREVRDTPVITVIEPPRLPFGPQRKRLISRGILGALVGGMLAGLAVLGREFFIGRRRAADADVEEFVSLLKPAGIRRRPADTR